MISLREGRKPKDPVAKGYKVKNLSEKNILERSYVFYGDIG